VAWLGKRLLLALAASVLGIAVLEVGARFVYGSYRRQPFDRAELVGRLHAGDADDDARTTGSGPQPAGALQDQRVILHPYFGYVVNPTTPGINKYGFFRAEPITTRGPDRVVIAFFGGSVADQIFNLGGPALIDALQQQPSLRGKRVELLSTALGGYKQPQQLLVLAALLAQGAQFDIVVNLDGFNEVDAATDNVQDGVNPFFPHHWNVHARQGLDTAAMARMGRVELIRAERAALRQRFSRWPVDDSAFLLTLWDLLDRRQEAALRGEMSALQASLAGAAPSPQVTGPAVTFTDDDDMYADFVEVWARSSLEMANLCRGQNIRYFHFLQPNQYFTGSKTLTDDERAIAWDADVADTQRVARSYPLLVERGRLLAAQGVDFTDLTMLFKHERRSVYGDTCCHFNQLGADSVARAIAAAIIQDSQ
jgi:hypothetical protein